MTAKSPSLQQGGWWLKQEGSSSRWEGTLVHVCEEENKPSFCAPTPCFKPRGPTREARIFISTSSLSPHHSISQRSDTHFYLLEFWPPVLFSSLSHFL